MINHLLGFVPILFSIIILGSILHGISEFFLNSRDKKDGIFLNKEIKSYNDYSFFVLRQTPLTPYAGLCITSIKRIDKKTWDKRVKEGHKFYYKDFT